MKKGVKILIIVLVLIIIGLVTFIVVDKVINKGTSNENISLNENNTVNGDSVSNNEVVISNNNLSESNTNGTNKKSTTTSIDYEKYIGVWMNDTTNSDEFEISSIQDGKITFTWFFYRLASIDNQTLDIDGNKFEFYFEEYKDSNFDGQETEDEKRIRKAIVELQDNRIYTEIKDVDQVEDKSKIIHDFNGSIYIGSGVYVYDVKSQQAGKIAMVGAYTGKDGKKMKINHAR